MQVTAYSATLPPNLVNALTEIRDEALSALDEQSGALRKPFRQVLLCSSRILAKTSAAIASSTDALQSKTDSVETENGEADAKASLAGGRESAQSLLPTPAESLRALCAEERSLPSEESQQRLLPSPALSGNSIYLGTNNLGTKEMQ